MAFFLANQIKADLALLRDLVETAKVAHVIDRTHPLAHTADAIRYLEEGHARGKVVVTI
jgi:NADPH:quinone reductase-like Zn-dependent oxidoreductase